jgi:hypothetical protein
VINDFIVSMSKRRFGGKRIEVEGFWVIWNVRKWKEKFRKV